MLGARTPAAKSWARLALRRSRRTFLGGGWWPGGIMLSHWTGLGSSPVRNSANQSGASGNCERNRSEEHTSELQSHLNLVCRLLLEKKKKKKTVKTRHLAET